jgi:two-component system, OmpR family, sensor kinase
MLQGRPFLDQWSTPMTQPRSIRFHLSAVFIFFFLLIFVLGMFSSARLRDFNNVSADIADQWLPTTGVLGDLNNFTSDFRAAEGSDLLSTNASEIAAIEMEMIELDRSISQAQYGYEQLHHDPDEAGLYAQFRESWHDYRDIVNRVLELSRKDHKTEAINLYMTNSRWAYNAASDALGRLTKQSVGKAHDASARVAVAYKQASLLINIAMGIAGVLVVAALLYIGRSISNPLLHLAGCMHRLAANDTDIVIKGTERRDEIGEMARAAVVFRNNAIELMIGQRGLAQQASMLEEKLTAERHLTQMQRNFVSMASHEFRTPLTIIDGHAQRLIKVGYRLRTDEINARAGKVRAAVLRMTHLIDNLLNSSRLIEGGAALYFHPHEFDLRELLHEICQLHHEIAPGYQLVETYDGSRLPMVGDPKLLSQVFNNLLSNAIKYSPGDSLIKIGARIESACAIIVVEDQGLGIPPGDVDRLFERYFRGSNVSGIVGTGVGLNLVKMVVDLHGGDILVESTEGKGSRFTVRLPVAPVLPADIAAPHTQPAPQIKPAQEPVEEIAQEPAQELAQEPAEELTEGPTNPARSTAADPLGA